MASNTQELFQTIDRTQREAIAMIGLDVLNASAKDIEQALWGCPRIQEILDSGAFTEGSIEFFRNPLVARYLSSVRGGESIRDKTPMLNIFREVLSRIDRMRSIDNAIRQVVEELTEILYSKSFQLRVFTILQNFKADNDCSLTIDREVRIRKTTYQETLPIHDLIRQTSTMWDGYNHDTSFYVAEMSFDHLVEKEYREAADSVLQQLHWALKLCSSKRVSISSTYFVAGPFNWHPFHLANATRLSTVESVYWDGKDEFVLDSSLLRSVQSMVESMRRKLDNLPDESASRFNAAMDRYIKADSSRAIVDIVTAFETVLLPGVEAELGFRLAQRTARLIGSTFEERTTIFDNMRKIYSARSKQVHGHLGRKPSDELMDLDTLGRDYLRRSLTCLLDVTDKDIGRYLDLLSFVN